MSDWEELDEQIKEEEKTLNAVENEIKKDLYNDEREDILIQERKKEEQKEVLPKEDDYERKWREKNKALLERKEEEKKAMENLSETDRAKKQQELTVISDVQDLFMGISTKDKELPQENEKVTFLKTEKDFMDFGIKVAAKLNRKEEYVEKATTKKGKEVKKTRNIYGSKLIYEFVKMTLENLMPHLDSNQLNDLNKNLNAQFNKTLLEEKKNDSGKVKANASKSKPQINMKKSTNGYAEDNYDQEYYEEYDDYNY